MVYIWWMKDIYVFHLIQCDQVLFNNPFWSSLSFEVFEMSSQIDCTHATPHSPAWLYRNYTSFMPCSVCSCLCVIVIPCYAWTELRSPSLASVSAGRSARSVPAGERQCSCSPLPKCFQTAKNTEAVKNIAREKEHGSHNVITHWIWMVLYTLCRGYIVIHWEI